MFYIPIPWGNYLYKTRKKRSQEKLRRGRLGRDDMVVELTTTYASSAYHD